MAEGNFYSYLYGRVATVAFDELADVVDLTSIESVNRAFEAYLKETPPPFELKDAFLEEKFFAARDKEQGSDVVAMRYELAVPGVEDDFSLEELKAYLEEFFDRIGAETSAENGAIVEVETSPDDRGGIDVDVYMEINGKQIMPKEKN